MTLVRTTSVALIVAAALTLAGTVPAAEKAKSTVSLARAVVSGPLEGAEGEFSMLVEAFAFRLDGHRAAALTADAFFGSVECATLASDVDVTFRGLARARVVGTITGECFDLQTSESSAYEAELDVVWRAVDPPAKARTIELFEGQTCLRKTSSRPPSAEGAFDWSALGLGLSGSARSIIGTEFSQLRDRCRPA